jgi:hypothetical protein
MLLDDYAVVAGGFFAVAGFAWKHHRAAAITSLGLGVAEATISMLTDYPGGVSKLISFENKGKIDAGLSAMVTTLPNFMGIEDEWPAWFFRAHGLAMATTAGLTDFSGAYQVRKPRFKAA